MDKKYKYCFKEKRLVEVGAHESVNETQEKVSIKEVHFDGNQGSVLTDLAAIYKESNDFFNNIPSKLCSLNLTQENYKASIDLIGDIVKQTKDICKKLVQKKCDSTENVCENIDSGCDHILSKLEQINTAAKLKNTIRKSHLFVAPVTKSIGFKWKNPTVDAATNIPDHGLTQSTFQYVPITETLKTLFADKDFTEQYVKYNLHEKHKCKSGVYEDFCCGSVYRSNKVFDDPLTLQLQIGIDDFEVCCPIKSKATKHKINATYFQVKNMPVEYRSKLNNIFLVAFCGSVNFKSDEYNYNHIAEIIVDEISQLETDGLAVGLNENIKGALINIACDNLGANSVFGFVESFVANYFCRHCECSKTECHTLVKENKKKRRTKAKYEAHVKRAESNQSKIDFTATKGVKRACGFNKLKYFHTIYNACVDVMHDVNEGVIAYTLHDLFNLLIKLKILSLGELQKRIRDFNYGSTFKTDKPSLINVDKHNLNQNAAQLYCLMVNMPFIFIDLKDKIAPYWKPIETLLQCMQIIYSPVITESDIKQLETHIQEHLKSVIEIFGRNLTPKHHFLLHYPECIRRMGPVIHLWTMRLESKHKVFTEIARRKMNFINLPKTLAFEHQERFCQTLVRSTPKIQPSVKSGIFARSMQFSKFEHIIKRDIATDINQLRVHKFAAYENIKYRESSLIIENSRIYEIVNILSNHSNVYFVCELFKVRSYENFCNSFVIEKEYGSTIALSFSSLKNKLVYDKIYSEDKYFVIVNKLALKNLIN